MEQAYIGHLQDQGCQVTTIEGVAVEDGSLAATVAAMRSGDQFIYQAALRHGGFAGRADILRRVDVPSALGAWSYEVIDTKLARETRGGTILQLSLYSELVGALQGKQPEYMYVVAPWTEFEPQQYRVDDYAAYYRLIRMMLESSVDQADLPGVYPDPKGTLRHLPLAGPMRGSTTSGRSPVPGGRHILPADLRVARAKRGDHQQPRR